MTKNTDFGTIAQSIAPVGIMMSIFSLIYSIWFGLAWGIIGWVLFGFIVLFCLIIIKVSIHNIKHANQFEANPTAQSKAIEKKM